MSVCIHVLPECVHMHECVLVCMREREKQRETERHRERQTDRQRERGRDLHKRSNLNCSYQQMDILNYKSIDTVCKLLPHIYLKGKNNEIP